MCNIYTNAVVNISATGVPNNTYSFLKTYEDSTVPLPPIIKHNWHSNGKRPQQGDKDTTSSTSDEAAEQADQWCVVDSYFWWSEVTNTVLLSRGWVFQERYLAPRVLHFGANQLLWECTTMDACEAYPRGLPDYVKSGGHTDVKRIQLDGTQLSSSADSDASAQTLSEAALHVWCDLVQAYTRTHLTKRSDKLVAFSGVAELVRKLYHHHEDQGSDTRSSNDAYTAGIFEQHLLLMLEWHTKRTLAPNSRPEEYRAPTWSWASIDGRVGYEFLPQVIASPSGLPWPPIWAQILRSPRYPATLPAAGMEQQQGAAWFPLVFDVEVGEATTTGIDERPQQQARPAPRLAIKLQGHILPLQSVIRVNSVRERGRPQPIVVEEDIRGEIFLGDARRGISRRL
ncbi:heterokaryon incompatibility protein-domain-containing protein [Apiospora marii]|uniref:heterokaryon incompatibility protein-domain-containing protein n=1 Tax=Apiospora marii TaxID=335849 RepID=UPI00312F45FF